MMTLSAHGGRFIIDGEYLLHTITTLDYWMRYWKFEIMFSVILQKSYRYNIVYYVYLCHFYEHVGNSNHFNSVKVSDWRAIDECSLNTTRCIIDLNKPHILR